MNLAKLLQSIQTMAAALYRSQGFGIARRAFALTGERFNINGHINYKAKRAAVVWFSFSFSFFFFAISFFFRNFAAGFREIDFQRAPICT